MSVGKHSPGNRVSLPIPARDSAIAFHTSSLLRPIEQMIPAPVIAMRMSGSGFRKVEAASRALETVDRPRSAESIRAAKLCGEGDPQRDHVCRLDAAIADAVFQSRQDSV